MYVEYINILVVCSFLYSTKKILENLVQTSSINWTGK
jgi:hypothetical protein